MSLLIEAVKRSALGPVQIKSPDTITGRYSFSDDFLGFSGHFPGYPILPAVVQLIAAQCLIEEQKGRKIELSALQNAKFLHEIRPNNEILIQCADCQIKEQPGSKIQIYSGDKIAASFLMIFQDKGN